MEDWVGSNLGGRKFREEFSVAVYHPVDLTVMLRCESFAFFYFGIVFIWNEAMREWWWIFCHRWFGRRVGVVDEDVLILGGCHVQCCSRNTISGYLIFISHVCGF